MGVSGVWPLLDDCWDTVTVESLRGQSLALDLSPWLKEAATTSFQPRRPFTTFPSRQLLSQRLTLLRRAGVDVTVVLESTVSVAMKRATLLRRYGPHLVAHLDRRQPARPAPRTLYARVLRDCVALLRDLGVPYIDASGFQPTPSAYVTALQRANNLTLNAGTSAALPACMEAEAFAAGLQYTGRCPHGVLTNDLDAFLHGARTVYTDFQRDTAASPSSPCFGTLRRYRLETFEARLGLGREHLIAMALLAGSDNNDVSLPGIGPKKALQLVKAFSNDDILGVLCRWPHQVSSQGDQAQLGERENVEKPLSKVLIRQVAKAVSLVPGFPNYSAMHYYMSVMPVIPDNAFAARRPPSIPQLLLRREMYGNHFVALLTALNMQRIGEPLLRRLFLPVGIQKQRCLKGHHVYDILWQPNLPNEAPYKDLPEGIFGPTYQETGGYLTRETLSFVQVFCPSLITAWEHEQTKAKAAKALATTTRRKRRRVNHETNQTTRITDYFHHTKKRSNITPKQRQILKPCLTDEEDRNSEHDVLSSGQSTPRPFYKNDKSDDDDDADLPPVAWL